MLAVICGYLATGSLFSDMQYGFRLSTNTILEVVREICQDLVDEFWESSLKPYRLRLNG